MSDYAVVPTGVAATWRVTTLTADEPAIAELRAALADLFHAARSSAAHRMREAGLPFATLTERIVVERERNGPGSWGTHTRKEARNTLAVVGPATIDSAAPLLAAADVAQVRDCASRLVEVSATLPLWSPFGGVGSELVSKFEERAPSPAYEDDPPEWVTQHVLLPALWWHLCALTSLEIGSNETALAFANEVVQVALAEYVWYQVVVPLSGMDLSGSMSGVLAEGDISIRSLSGAEQGHWVMEFNNLSGQTMGWDAPRVALEISFPGPRNAQHMPTGGPTPFLLLAFQLHGFDIASSYAPEYCNPRWIHPFTFSVAITLPRRTRAPTTIELSESDFVGVMATARLLGGYRVSAPRSPQELALHRFASGVARRDDADAVLDFMIGLEALFVPGNSPADISYRFAVHGAHYLSDDVPNRPLIRDQLRNIYKMRNDLVHGNKYPEQSAIATARTDSQELLRRGLLRAVHEGFPTPDMFVQMLLGTEFPKGHT